jgi:hypothetical protein
MIDRRFYRPFVMLLILATMGCSIMPPPQGETFGKYLGRVVSGMTPEGRS